MKIHHMLSMRNAIIYAMHTPNIYNINNINCIASTKEHIFPKCYMTKKGFNDMHNLFKADKEINNNRSNYKFVDFNYIDKYPYDFKKISNNYISHKYKLFIPEEESRGIISRAIMYMTYEYKYKYYKIIDTETLIDWCLKYPPSKEEYYHNEIAFKHQYTRNKFIDIYYKKNYKKYIYSIF